ncbi:Mis12-Mtw1 protein family-domain-containing protein [Cyathus striatus]|nr:Mis12-Mtw1 protein family-domain-containing protein [Cyathus striatus]
MDDEADHLRRTSRAVVDDMPVGGGGGEENPFAFPTLGGKGRGRKPKGSKNKASSSQSQSQQAQSKLGKTTDTSQPISVNETPKIQRNKLLREGSLALITGDNEDEEERGRGVQGGQGGRHRRKSSLSRGKRVSSRYEGGVVTQPHPSVSDSTFYKHIDADLPDSERVRQLLIWCSLRASGSSLGSSSFTPSKPKPSAALESLPSASSLPVLSEKAKEVLKEAQDEIVRMIAEKKVDLSLYNGDAPQGEGEGEGEQVENEQNVRNRGWEVVYGGHVKKAQEEEESWKKVSYAYEAYAKKVQAGIEKDLAATSIPGPSRARSVSVEPESAMEAPTTPSAKAKGKQREVKQIRVDDLPEDLQRGWMLARGVMTQDKGKGKAKDIPSQATTSSRVEAEIRDLLPDVQFKLDVLFSSAARAKAIAGAIEQMIDERFDVLGRHLDARLHSARTSSGSSTTRLLATYLPHPSSSSIARKEDPKSLFRALSRIDSARPLAQVGDAARKAAREVQRVNVPVAGERKLTFVGGIGGVGTPRKAPGTPRRGSTPGREREKER